jgi:hypothetical protein
MVFIWAFFNIRYILLIPFLGRFSHESPRARGNVQKGALSKAAGVLARGAYGADSYNKCKMLIWLTPGTVWPKG